MRRWGRLSISRRRRRILSKYTINAKKKDHKRHCFLLSYFHSAKYNISIFLKQIFFTTPVNDNCLSLQKKQDKQVKKSFINKKNLAKKQGFFVVPPEPPSFIKWD